MVGPLTAMPPSSGTARMAESSSASPSSRSSVGGVFFSADWDELWVGIERSLVTVAVSRESGFTADTTVIRATMNFGSLLRRPAAFARA